MHKRQGGDPPPHTCRAGPGETERRHRCAPNVESPHRGGLVKYVREWPVGATPWECSSLPGFVRVAEAFRGSTSAGGSNETE
jgi:hypothetical protein